MLKIYLAGEIQALRDDAPPVLVTEGAVVGRQARLALAFLVLNHRRTVLRDELADLLWPDELPAAWEVALRAVISKLRAALAPIVRAGEGSPIGAAEAGGYRFTFPGTPWVDIEQAAWLVHEAETALGRGQLAEAGGGSLAAAAIAVRPFLAGIEGDWVERQRGILLELRVRSLDVRSEVLLRMAQPDEAARDATRILDLDPYHERAIRRVMRAHTAADDRAHALLAYAAFRARLASELGAEPSAETRRLRDAIATGAMVSVEGS